MRLPWSADRVPALHPGSALLHAGLFQSVFASYRVRHERRGLFGLAVDGDAHANPLGAGHRQSIDHHSGSRGVHARPVISRNLSAARHSALGFERCAAWAEFL